MHFELDISPEELAKGIDRATVKRLTDARPALPDARASVLVTPTGMQPHLVIARDGLRVRSGPSDSAAVVRALPLGTRVNVLSRWGQWAQVDLQGDGLADGFMFLAFLKPVSDEPSGTGRRADTAAPGAVDRPSVLGSIPTEPWIAAVTEIAARSKIAD